MIVTMMIGIVILLIAASFKAADKLYDITLNPKADRSFISQAPHNALDISGRSPLEKEADEIWWQNADYQDLYIESYDILKLHAYCIHHKQPNNLWMICVHGYTASAADSTPFARRFYEQGYNLILPNLRGHGQSEGHYIGMGWHDRLDIMHWIHLIVERYPDAKIALFGISMGGSTVMMTAGEKLPENVFAIINDCGYSSVWMEFSYQVKVLFKLPNIPILNLVSLITKIRAGFFIEEANAVKQLKKTNLPVLFIHGDCDTFVPSHMVDTLYEAAAGEKDKLIVADAGHGQSALLAGEAYWDKVFAFLTKYAAYKPQ